MTNDVHPRAAASSSNASSTSITPEPSFHAPSGDDASRPRSKHSRTSCNFSKRRTARSHAAEFLSDRATAQLIRRVLCSQQAGDRVRTSTPQPIDELLPPLTSRNDVDLQLYAMISIVLRDFVQTWYSKITPDKAFVAEIVLIIAHCTRGLEQRLRMVDLESLLLDELPDLLDKHVQAYRASRQPIVKPPVQVDALEIYHSLCPLPYLSPIPRVERPETVTEQAENEFAFRQLLVQAVLAVLLPTEDLENDCLTSIVGQILSELIIGNIIGKKASEPWMIWIGLSMLAEALGRRRQDTQAAAGLERHLSSTPATKPLSIFGWLWACLHHTFSIMTLILKFVLTVATSRSLPSRGQPFLTKSGGSATQPESDLLVWNYAKKPFLAYGIWSTISNLIHMERRMPWLLGSLSMTQWIAIAGPGRMASFDGAVDRFLSDYIRRHILDPAILPSVLRSLRGVLFPNNAMGAQTLCPPESDQELLSLRHKCASALGGLIPRLVGRLYYGGIAASFLAACLGNDEPQRVPTASSRSGPDSGEGLSMELDADIVADIEMDILDVFSDPYCNKHLMYSALELVLVRLIPELSEKGVVELWEERSN